MAWSNPELDATLGCRPEQVSHATLQRLVDNSVEEGELLDFKLDLPDQNRDTGSWSRHHETAKDIAAFANARGGLLVFGVGETQRVATSIEPIMRVTPEAMEQTIRQAVRNHTSPLPQVQIISVPAPAGGFSLLVIVPPGDQIPHAVTDTPGQSKPSLRFPRRHGTDTVWLREHEVADLYQRRFRTRDEQQQGQRKVIDDALAVLRESTRLWYWIAVLPDRTMPGRLDNAAVDAMQAWWRSTDSTPLGRSIEHGLSMPAPGRLTFRDFHDALDDEDVPPRFRYTEIHVGGAAFSASAIASFTTRDDPEHARPVGEITLVDESIALVDAATNWATHTVGAWGTATVAYGLADGGVDLRRIELVEDSPSGLRRMRMTRRHGPPVDLRGETTIDLSAVETTQDRLAACHLVLSGALQWFGRAEPSQILPDGTLNLDRWPPDRRREIQAWALHRDVAVLGASDQ